MPHLGAGLGSNNRYQLEAGAGDRMGAGSHQGLLLTNTWFQTSSLKKGWDMWKIYLSICALQKRGEGDPYSLKGKNQERSKAGVSCYLCLRGKLGVLGSFPQQHNPEEAVLFYQPYIRGQAHQPSPPRLPLAVSLNPWQCLLGFKLAES